VRVS
jgi:hypothetical protein